MEIIYSEKKIKIYKSISAHKNLLNEKGHILYELLITKIETSALLCIINEGLCIPASNIFFFHVKFNQRLNIYITQPFNCRKKCIYIYIHLYSLYWFGYIPEEL